jgi:hypothetical protein
MSLRNELISSNAGQLSQKCDKCANFRYRILCFVDHRGKSDVQDFYDSGTAELQAAFEVAISYLREMSRQEWTRPKAARLNKYKDFKDFFEIRFKANNVQQRPIGYFGPGEDEFTILIWLKEQGNKLIPDTWCKSANAMKEQIENVTASVKCLKFYGDEKCIAPK